MSSDSDSTTTSSSDSEVQKKPVPVTKNDTSSSSDSDSEVNNAPAPKKVSSSSDSSDSESDEKPAAPAKKESSSSDSSDSESDKKPAKKESSSSSSESESESDKKPAKKESSSDSDSSSESESDKKPAKKAAKKESSSSESESESESDKKPAKKVAKKAAKKAASDSSDSDSESEEKPAKKAAKKAASSSDDDEEEEEGEKGGLVSGFKGWLEQRRVKKREQDNIEFSKKVVLNWRYKRDGALAKKVCYEGMLPHTRIMSWSTMIGNEIRIAQKLYKVNLKNGKGLLEKFEKNPDAPTEGSEKTVLDIPKAVKDVFPTESSFHTANFEKDLTELLCTWVAYRPDIGFFDGLNYIAAMCLEFQDAETAFSSAVNLINEYILIAIDPERKAEFKQYQVAFESALSEEVPEVANYFSENNVESSVILRDWMCSLFTRCVNFEKAKRLWDILLLEGGFGLVKISCGILKFYAEKITDMNAEAIYKFLKNLPEKANIDKLSDSIKSIQLAQVDFNLMLEDAKSAGADSDSEDEKIASKKIESDSDSEEEEPKKEEPKKVESDSDSDSSDSDVKPVTIAAAKKVVSSDSSDSSSSEDEKPAPKPAPKKVESSSSDSSSSSEDEKPAPKPAPKKVESSSSSDSSSSEDEKPAPKPAPKKVESSSSDYSSSD